ncbi:hypothetical protein C8J57DRAFT_519875 [Mycena rebaudengoi]|nr:hypothetical protein C8J57DRAFT_519875 [Mycena rebaudengoi]
MSSSVTLFIESNNTRREVSSDPKYSPICTLIANALQHLISSPALVILYTTIWSIFLKSDAAAAAFKEKFGEGVPTQDQLVAYLRNQPPAVIIADGTNDVGEFSWGSVLKGSSELAQNNELFLSQELVTALLDKTDPISASVSETDYKRLAFRLIFIVTYFHEVQHCASKYFFSPFCSRQALPHWVQMMETESANRDALSSEPTLDIYRSLSGNVRRT